MKNTNELLNKLLDNLDEALKESGVDIDDISEEEWEHVDDEIDSCATDNRFFV